MATAIDELRNTLVNRARNPQQPLPGAPAGAPAQQPYAPQGIGGLMGGMGNIPVLNAPTGQPTATKRAPASLLSGLQEALKGTTGAGNTPRTGATPPAWPGTPMPMGPGELPVGLPNESSKVPPRWKRFETGQKMIEGYKNNWNPNPILTRILEGGGKY